MDSRSRKVMLVLVAAAALAAAPLSAALLAQAGPAAIDGTWNMTVTGPDGSPMAVTAVFKTEGKKVTGSLTSQMGEVALEGEYEAGKLAFGISMDGPEGPMRIGFAGTFKDDGSLAGMASGPFGEIPWTATKTK